MHTIQSLIENQDIFYPFSFFLSGWVPMVNMINSFNFLYDFAEISDKNENPAYLMYIYVKSYSPSMHTHFRVEFLRRIRSPPPLFQVDSPYPSSRSTYISRDGG